MAKKPVKQQVKNIPYMVLCFFLFMMIPLHASRSEEIQTIPIAAVQFNQPHEVFSDSGYHQIKWNILDQNNTPKPEFFELEKSSNKDFKNAKRLYSGPDQASFISGLPNGDLYFRVRGVMQNQNIKGPWSKPLFLRVKHQSLKLAMFLFSIGGVVFLATATVIIRGNRNPLPKPSSYIPNEQLRKLDIS